MTKRKYRTYQKKVAPKNDVLIVNRFETLCGQCRYPQTSLTVNACPSCLAEFKRVTTECVNVTWLPDSIRAQRPDLEWISFDEYVG